MPVSALHSGLGLARNPFPPTPDAGSYFFTSRLHEQFTELKHCIEARKGFVLLTGEVGLGKSTMVRRLLDVLPPDRTRTALIFNTFLQGGELLAAILQDFDLQPTGTLNADLALLNAFLMEQHRADVTCLLVVDDAQNLVPGSLELIRLLCNLETGQEKLLQILLAGQPELEALLCSPPLRQLHSRVVKHARLSEFSLAEVVRYFHFRTDAAGSAGRITLQPSAARQLHSATSGNLRQIHLVLDRCLYGLSALGVRDIDPTLVQAALRDACLPSRRRIFSMQRRPAVMVAGGALAVLAVCAVVLWIGPSATSLSTTGKADGGMSAFAATIAPPALALATPAVAMQPPETQPGNASFPTDCDSYFPGASGEAGKRRQPIGSDAAQRLRGVPGVCVMRQGTLHTAVWEGGPAAAEAPAVSTVPTPATLSLQRALLRHDLLATADVDGFYGPRTASALARFQAAQGLTISPTPDALTLLLLERP